MNKGQNEILGKGAAEFLKQKSVINWEIDQYFEKLSVHDQEVSLTGVDGFGRKFTAFAILSCDSIEEITEITEIK